MLGGTWAFRVEYDRNFSQRIRSAIFNRDVVRQYSLNRDQEFLRIHLWPYAQHNAMSHDSYLCTITDWNRHHRPFPTERPILKKSRNCFIGCPKPCCVIWPFNDKPCPVECRPKEHQDWTYC